MAPYIGITGFMSPAEVRSVLEVVPHHTSRKLMVGVLASWKTVCGLINKYPGRYPTMRDIGSIFIDDPRAINLVHYATDDIGALVGQVGELKRFIGPHHQGYQLNLRWPEPRIVARLMDHRHRIVLQIGRGALEEIGHDPAVLADVLESYSEIVTDILVDPSAGKGRTFDPVMASELLLAVRERHPHLGLGVAGGLSAQTLHLVEPLVRFFPDLNIDAEGRLRDTVDDRLDIGAAREYVAKAYTLFC